MKLMDFYKKVLHSLGLEVSQDDFVQINLGGKPTMFTVNGKPMVLPTKEHIDTSIEPDENGNIMVTKVLFNPLNEDVIKGDSTSLKKVKDIAEKKLAHTFAAVGELLLTLASNPKLQKKTDMELNKFLIELNNVYDGKAKDKVDDKSVDTWSKMYAKSLKEPASKSFLKLYLKKNGRYDGNRYNRLAVASFPFYEMLLEADKTTPVYGYKLRIKDLAVYKLIYTYVFNMMDENHSVVVGSNDNESPGFISLFKLYIKLGTRMNKILKSLTNVNRELVKEATLPIEVSDKDLEKLNIFKSELFTIPSELELNRQKAPKQQTQQEVVQQQPTTYVPGMQQQVQAPQPTQTTVTENDTASTVHKILYGGAKPQVQQPVQPVYQQPTVPAYAQPAPPQNARPVGINQVQQPIAGYQQPQYGQPMQQYAQPMMQQAQPMPQYGQPMQQQAQPMPQYAQPMQQQARPVGINQVQQPIPGYQPPVYR